MGGCSLSNWLKLVQLRHLCMCTWVYLCAPCGCGCSWKAEGELKLKFQEFVSHLVWILETKLRTSARASNTITQQNCPVPTLSDTIKPSSMCFSGVGDDSRPDVVGKSGTPELSFLTCPGLRKHLRSWTNCPKAVFCSWAFILKDQTKDRLLHHTPPPHRSPSPSWLQRL